MKNERGDTQTIKNARFIKNSRVEKIENQEKCPKKAQNDKYINAMISLQSNTQLHLGKLYISYNT